LAKVSTHNQDAVPLHLLEQEKQPLGTLHREPQHIEASLESFKGFCSTISGGLGDLAPEEK
jgi:hypothetical protein